MGDVGSPAFHTWCQGLGDLNGRQVGHGLDRLLDAGEDWPPSLPQFRRFCKGEPEELGLPSQFDAFGNACNCAGQLMAAGKAEWLHPAVEIAARATGLASLARAVGSNEAVKKKFKRNYLIVCRRYGDGDDLGADIPEALPAEPEYRRADKSVMLRAMASVKAKRADPARVAQLLKESGRKFR